MPSTPTATPLRPRPPGSRRSRAYRLTRRAILAALFGVIATYAVAWAAVLHAWNQKCESSGSLFSPAGERTGAARHQWWSFTRYSMPVQLDRRKSGFKATSPDEMFRLSTPARMSNANVASPRAFADWARAAPVAIDFWGFSGGSRGGITLEDAGWPFKSVTCWSHWNKYGAQVSRFGAWIIPEKILPAFASHFAYARLSYTPIWPNFLFSVLFYGALYWLLLESSTALRRRLRRHRGLCTHCRYDLRGLPPTAPCPECGLTR